MKFSRIFGIGSRKILAQGHSVNGIVTGVSRSY